MRRFKKIVWNLVAGAATLAVGSLSYAADGLVSVKSAHDVPTTVERLVNVLGSKGMKVFAVIDHQAGAASTGVALKPTTLVIFGNPKVGTPLMGCARSVAIDLPQKALIWQDDAGVVWLAYNDPQYLNKRHGLQSCGPVLQKVKGALGNFAAAATSP